MRAYFDMLRILLVSFLITGFFQGHGQIRISKRKHLKGYHIEFGSGKSVSSNFKGGVGTIKNEDSLQKEPIIVNTIHQIAESGVFKEVKLQEAQQDWAMPIGINHFSKVMTGSEAYSKKFKKNDKRFNLFIPIGAGLLKKQNLSGDELTPMTGLDNCAVLSMLLGFIALLVQIVSFFMAIESLGALVLLFIPGLILGVIGVYSENKRTEAIVGICLNIAAFLLLLASLTILLGV